MKQGPTPASTSTSLSHAGVTPCVAFHPLRDPPCGNLPCCLFSGGQEGLPGALRVVPLQWIFRVLFITSYTISWQGGLRLVQLKC